MYDVKVGPMPEGRMIHNGIPSCDSGMPTAPPVQVAFANLNRITDETPELLKALEAKLGGVMSQSGPACGNSVEEKLCVCEVAAGLNNQSQRVSRTNEQIRSILARLEL